MRGFIQQMLSEARSGEGARRPLDDGVERGAVERRMRCGYLKRGCHLSQNHMDDWFCVLSGIPPNTTHCLRETVTFTETLVKEPVCFHSPPATASLWLDCVQDVTRFPGVCEFRLIWSTLFSHTIWNLICCDLSQCLLSHDRYMSPYLSDKMSNIGL